MADTRDVALDCLGFEPQQADPGAVTVSADCRFTNRVAAERRINYKLIVGGTDVQSQQVTVPANGRERTTIRGSATVDADAKVAVAKTAAFGPDPGTGDGGGGTTDPEPTPDPDDPFTGQYADLLRIETDPEIGVSGDGITFKAMVRNNTGVAGAPVTVEYYLAGTKIGQQSRTLGDNTYWITLRKSVDSLPVGNGYYTYKAVLDVRGQSRSTTIRLR